jgi:hypothetical protein
MKFAHHMTTMLRATAVAASAAALVAPAAAAMTRGTTDGTTGDMSDAVSRYITNHGAPVSDAVDRWLATHSVSPANGVQGYRFITDTLGGNGRVAVSAKPPADAIDRWLATHSVAKPPADAVDRWLATHSVSPANGVPGYRFITDTLGGNGGAAASAPAAGGTGLDWGALGMGVGLGVLLSAFLVGARRIGRARRLAHS